MKAVYPFFHTNLKGAISWSGLLLPLPTDWVPTSLYCSTLPDVLCFLCFLFKRTCVCGPRLTHTQKKLKSSNYYFPYSGHSADTSAGSSWQPSSLLVAQSLQAFEITSIFTDSFCKQSFAFPTQVQSAESLPQGCMVIWTLVQQWSVMSANSFSNSILQVIKT